MITDQDKAALTGVLDKLATQGSADQVADFFRREGIVGMPSDVTSCPVARYVQRELGAVIWINPADLKQYNDGRLLGMAGFGDDCDDERDGVRLPDPVNAFACSFDKQVYKDLIDTQEAPHG